MNGKYETATPLQVIHWFQEGIFTLDHQEIEIWKGDRQLTQRRNTRRRSERGDPRVDLFHQNWRRSIHVSHLVWMVTTGQVIPEGWEIHHRDEDPENNWFENLLALHPLDHHKLHRSEEEDTYIDDDLPF